MISKAFIISLASLTYQSHGELTIVSGQEDSYVYHTPRYSRFMGDFDRDCSITANLASLFFTEDICDLSTITGDYNNTILMVSFLESGNCKPIDAYVNAQKLGVAAFLHVDVAPPGRHTNWYYYGTPLNEGSVPFIDSGFEFFVNYRFHPNASNIVAHIEGCDDYNRVEFCYNKVQAPAYALIGMFGFFIVYLSYSAFKKIDKSEGTKPRRFILAAEGWITLFAASIVFSGSFLTDTHAWLFGDSVIGLELKNLNAVLYWTMSTGNTMICAAYWNYLRQLCFVRKMHARQQSFFKSPAFIFAVVFLIGFFITEMVFIFGEGFSDPYLKIIYATSFTDFTVMALLFLASLRFIERANNYVETKASKTKERATLDNASSGNDESSMNDDKDKRTMSHKIWALFSPLWNTQLEKKLASVEGSDNFSRSTVLLTVHLSKWLARFVFFQSIQLVLFLYFFRNVTMFLKPQDTPHICAYLIIYWLSGLIHFLLSLCKIMGVKGPVMLPTSGSATGTKTATTAVVKSNNTRAATLLDRINTNVTSSHNGSKSEPVVELSSGVKDLESL